MDGKSGSQCVPSLEGAFYVSSLSISSGELSFPASSLITRTTMTGTQSIDLMCEQGSATPHLLVAVSNFTVHTNDCRWSANNNGSTTIKITSYPSDEVVLNSCGDLSTLLV